MSLIFGAVKNVELFRFDHPRVDATPSSVPAPVRPPEASRPGKDVSPAERRKQGRASVAMLVRVRPADPADGHFKEILQTMNSSRGGIYFVAESGHYYPGMRLRVAFPYSSSYDTVAASEEIAEVNRIESLRDNQKGVVVLLRGPAEATRLANYSASSGPGRIGKERRAAKRYPFSAAATVTEAQSGTRLQARCSDLSVKGCYVDTLNPFPAGTGVHVRLFKGERVFDSAAQAVSSHVGMGMGLKFNELVPEHDFLLTDVSVVEVCEVAPIAAAVETSESRNTADHELLTELLLLLKSKAILTSGDIAALNPGTFDGRN